jgi:lipopolysaccharide transport system ATP-binding protein
MSKPVIRSEDVWKQYQLGVVGTQSLSNDLRRWMARIRGKEDPFLKVGETNDRTKKSESDYVWALQGVSFQINQGEVIGVVGKNGAGKSTLLKLLSRVTVPTKGEIRVRGKIASLLEVGTGFHPDLTGRENIFLNGTIMGMRKKEVAAQFDEIVEFSGVERYIDTPVKRYSSGMYVRLAFAVAAHLEPDIMVIDEVLAVGDAEFQKKCLGKMKSVSEAGRTVIFVSHNMAAVNNLCSRTLLMHQGKCVMDGKTPEVVAAYFEMSEAGLAPGEDRCTVPRDWERPWGRKDAWFQRIEIRNPKNEATDKLMFLQAFSIQVRFLAERRIENATMQIRIGNPEGQQITISTSQSDTNTHWSFEPGEHTVRIQLDPKLMPGTYSLFVYLGSPDGSVFYDAIPSFHKFQIGNLSEGNTHYLSSKINTFIHHPCKWEIIN